MCKWRYWPTAPSISFYPHSIEHAWYIPGCSLSSLSTLQTAIFRPCGMHAEGVVYRGEDKTDPDYLGKKCQGPKYQHVQCRLGWSRSPWPINSDSVAGLGHSYRPARVGPSSVVSGQEHSSSDLRALLPWCCFICEMIDCGRERGPGLAVVLFSSKKLAFLRTTINLCVFLFLSFLRKQICVNYLGSCPSMVHELGPSWVKVYFMNFVFPWLFLSLATFQLGWPCAQHQEEKWCYKELVKCLLTWMLGFTLWLQFSCSFD